MNLNDLTGAMSGLSESNRPIRLRLSHEQRVLDDVLLVQRASGTETICGGIEYQLQCVSTDAHLPLKEFIALPIELQFVTDRGALRSVCGIVAQALAGQSDGGLATYQLVVRDALALMEQRTNTRVFRNASEVDITEVMLAEWRGNPVLARAFEVDLSQVTGKYPVREFTMQHNESDAHFLRRLWKRRGLSWFIRPGKASEAGSNDTPAHTLVLFDDASTLTQNAAGTVRYHRDDGTEGRDSITAWSPVRTLRPGSVARHSWDYAQAGLMASSGQARSQQGTLGDQFAASLEDYLIDMPHAGDTGDDYRRLGDLRLLRHEYESKCFHGEGSVRDLCVGQWIGLTDHPEIDTHPPEEREFVVTALTVHAENNLPKTLSDKAQRLLGANCWEAGPDAAALEQASDERGVRYSNHFTCVRRGIPIVPAFDPRADLPRPRLQSAIVVGPDGEEVHCDQYGRVKIRFPGARTQDHSHAQGAGASATDRDSAWVRVASTWASNQWGTITLPRVGDEVMVDFVGGDPDKPIIVGQVYNGTAPPPTFSHAGSLPGNKYLAGIKSKEVQGARYNQLRLDDTPGQINAQLASEHAHSELNLGWLTHPRHDGKGEARGEGAELRSDRAVVVRAAQLMLLTTQAMLQAQGKQLERGPLETLLENSHSLLEALGQYAEQHNALAVDLDAHKKINTDLRNAEQGTNTQPSGASADPGGAPLIAHYAEGGFASATPYSSVNYSGQHQNLIAQRNIQLVAGDHFNVNAGKGISLFAHKDGIKQIAHHGKFEIQAQHDSIDVAADQNVKISAINGEVIIVASKKITLVSGGAYLTIGDGKIEHGCPGEFTVKAGMHNWAGPASASQAMQKFSEGSIDFNERFVLTNKLGDPVANRKYEIKRADGTILRGVTDALGNIEQQQSLVNENIQIKILG
jgi:type VI secretion system secreted protein VgrG